MYSSCWAWSFRQTAKVNNRKTLVYNSHLDCNGPFAWHPTADLWSARPRICRIGPRCRQSGLVVGLSSRASSQLARHLLLHHSHPLMGLLTFLGKSISVGYHLKTKTDWCRPHSTTTRPKLWGAAPLVEAYLLHLSMLRLKRVGRCSKRQARGALRAKVLNARSTSCTVSCLTRAHARGGIGSISFTLYARWSLIN